MSKKKKKNSAVKKKKNADSARASNTNSWFQFLKTKWVQESLGIVLSAVTIFRVISLLTLSLVNNIKFNRCGVAGIYTSHGLYTAFGFISWIFPLVLFFLGILAIRHRRIERIRVRFIGFLMMTGSLCGLFAFHGPAAVIVRNVSISPGGALGTSIKEVLKSYFGRYGGDVILLSCLLISILLITDISYYEILSFLRRKFSSAVTATLNALKLKFHHWREKRQYIRDQKAEQKTIARKALQDERMTASTEEPPVIAIPNSKGSQPELFDEEYEPPEIEGPAFSPIIRTRLTDFELPGLEYLTDTPVISQREPESELLKNSEMLVSKLNEFNIQSRVTEVCPGPVITRYEIEPAPGVKISKITGLVADLALGLKAKFGLRVAPVPGKSTLGVEIPNKRRETVYLKEVLESQEFYQATQKSKLIIPLGKDTSGHPFVADLKKMPHLLIAGATGSGKSVCINTILTGLLFNCTPKELRLILIDPKMLELCDFNGIPHLREPVISDVKLTPDALNWAVEEMERRYRLLASSGVRNIDQYNTKVSDPGYEGDGEPLPYLVIVIDELADLMLSAPSAIEEAIQRLAQMARASGIHLIIATQRPSVDVITGVIKANLPCRLAFQVASRIDSRTILDSMGAEKLLGMGDCLFIPPGTSQLLRVHGAFVSEGEVKRVVEFLKTQPDIEDEDSIFTTMEEARENSNDVDDPLYEDAVKLVLTTGLASISMLQRRLKVGHSRASRLIDSMELCGVVGPHIGSKPREIIIDRDEYLGRLQEIEETGLYEDI